MASSRNPPGGFSVNELDSIVEQENYPNAGIHPLRHSVSNPPPVLPSSHTSMGRFVSKKRKGTKQTLPPVVARENVEKRIEELERLAAASSAQQKSAQAVVSYTSAPSNMSGSEVEFLARQIGSAESLSQFSLGATSVQGGYDGVDDLASIHSMQRSQSMSQAYPMSDTSLTINEALRNKLLEAEKQLASLSKQLRKKDAEIDKKDAKLQSVMKDLQQARLDAQQITEKLQAQHQMQLLQLREAHSQEKAKLLQQQQHQPTNAAEPSEPSGVHGQSPPRGGGVVEGNRKLLEQLDALRAELRKAHNSALDERRALQAELDRALQAAESRHQSELLQLRSAASLLEDKALQLRDELRASQAETQSARRQAQESERFRAKALEDAQRLQADLRNMQQSVQASFRLDAAHSQGSGSAQPTSAGDVETHVKLVEAKAEAKVKQMAHKLDFLKSQLETEKKALEALQAEYAQTQRALLNAQSEHDAQLQEKEAAFRRRLEDKEREVAERYERRMAELTTLQREVRELRQTAQAAQQDSAAQREREEQLSAQNDQLSVALLAARSEAEQLRAQLANLAQEHQAAIQSGAGGKGVGQEA
eukprot:gene36757-44589_t